MNLLKDSCCNTETLEVLQELYHSNADEFVLMQCPTCKLHWLYRKLESNWLDNIRFGWDEYEAWYIKIAEDDMSHVLAGDFEKIKFNGTYLYISTEGKIPVLKKVE